MKTLVHIGMSKSGSTALQNTLAKSRRYLRSKGVLYPDNPRSCPFNNHRLLVASYRKYDDLPRHIRNRDIYTSGNIAQKTREFHDCIQRQIRRRKPDCVVLSSETLFHRILEDNRDAVRQTYAEFGDNIGFMAYLRRPADHFLSSLQQGLRATHRIKTPRAPAFRIVLETYEECFGSRITVRQFHRETLENGNVIDDFSRHFLGEYGVGPGRLTAAKFSNESVSAESMDILARYRARFHGDRHNVLSSDTRSLVVELAAADRQVGASRPKLRDGVANMIDHSRDDPLWLRDEMGIEFLGFDYATLEKNGSQRMRKKDFLLDELVEIDREKQVAVLEVLLESEWAASSPKFGDWVHEVLKAVGGREHSGASVGLEL
ncbi:hypothetical protein [Amaricoccus tamworthensis]|uniref:hypothetical protein n=1 Tax=Amaricoccus tamworthensis TaxID=57002 RepID=UPI003C7C0A83